MWVLYIVSIISFGPDVGELRFTKYDTYDTEYNCKITEAILSDSFSEDEETQCRSVWQTATFGTQMSVVRIHPLRPDFSATIKQWGQRVCVWVV